MKLKLVMSDAETGEVLHEATDLNFAMMCFAKEDAERLDFEAKTQCCKISAYGHAKSLMCVQESVAKCVKEAPEAVQDIVESIERRKLIEMATEAIRKQTNGAVPEDTSENKEEAAE